MKNLNESIRNATDYFVLSASMHGALGSLWDLVEDNSVTSVYHLREKLQGELIGLPRKLSVCAMKHYGKFDSNFDSNKGGNDE